VQRALGIPVSLFTAIFALARTVGWIAQLNEMIGDPEYKIGRPRQLFELGYDGITDPISKQQVTTLNANIKAFGAAAFFPFLDKRQGIVHVIGPEQGATLPGMTVVCGDSHTSTHGAFGALAHGIGTSEVEHVLATQTLLAKKAKNMLVRVDGTLRAAAPPRTSCWRSSAASARPAAPATPSSSAAARSARSAWKAA
jgi:hypothetical protein